ncbi:hypothetical protein Tco_0296469 [Tanacetum coccineum]
MSAKGEKIVGKSPVFIGQTRGASSIEDEEMSLVDDVLEGALGALGCRNGGSSRGHGGLWWLMMDENDGELVICIWREFIGRDLFENGMNLNSKVVCRAKRVSSVCWEEEEDEEEMEWHALPRSFEDVEVALKQEDA